MPLDDALSLVSKDFDHYMLSGRPATGPRRQAPPTPDVPQLLGRAASGASLSSSELSAVISALQKQQQQDDEIASSSHHGTYIYTQLYSPHTNTHTHTHTHLTSVFFEKWFTDVCRKLLSNSITTSSGLEKVEANTPEDIQRQQADLQAKILSLLGSSAVVPSSSSASSPLAGTSKPASSSGYESTLSRGGASVNYQQSGYRGRGYGSGYGGQSDGAGYRGGYGQYSGYQ